MSRSTRRVNSPYAGRPSTAPTIRAPIDDEARCGIRGEDGAADVSGLPTLKVEEAHARRLAGEPFEILDVREPHEYEIARIPGATLFPLSQLTARLHELDSSRSYTISCHRGVRSVRAYRLLHEAGFAKLRVLDGGVDAWAERIDPTMPRY